MGEGFGFKTRKATFVETLRFTILTLIASPVPSGLAILWWVLMSVLLFHTICWMIRPSTRPRRHIAVWITALFARIAAIGALIVVLGFASWLAPTPAAFQILSFLISLPFSAALILWLRRGPRSFHPHPN